MARTLKKLDNMFKNRRPTSYTTVTPKRFESATGTPFSNTQLEKEDLQKKYDEEKDPKKKKRIRQTAHFSGHSLKTEFGESDD